MKKKPPEWGYVHWDKATFDKLVTSEPEELKSTFTLSHGAVVSVMARDESGGCMGLARLIKAAHENRIPVPYVVYGDLAALAKANEPFGLPLHPIHPRFSP